MVSECVQRKDNTCDIASTKVVARFLSFLLGPDLTVVVEPPEISGNASEETINLTCTAMLMDVATTIQYQLFWLLNGAPINQSDTQIVVWMYCL